MRQQRLGLMTAVTLGALLTLCPPPARATLVAYWTFDEGSGTTATDVVGSHDGTLTNGPAWTTDTPLLAYANPYALSFDNVNDYVVATGYKAITGDMPRSISAWIKTNSTGDEAIISWGTDSAGQKWIFRVQDDNGTAGAIRVEVSQGYVVGKTSVADGAWHHVVAVLPNMSNPDADDILLYVDGNLETPYTAIDTQAITTARGSDVRIGQDHSNRYFDGLIDDVQIYNHPLSLAEIQALADGQAPPTPSRFERAVLASDPLAYWRLSDNGPWAPALGSIGDQLYSDYRGGYTQGVPSLLMSDPDPAVRFDGTLGHVYIPDHTQINTGTSYEEKSVELFFMADDVGPRQVLYEEGGNANGLNIYIEDGLLYVGAWSSGASPSWQAFLSTQVKANTRYMVDLVMDGDPSGTTGTLTGYLNGEPFHQTDGIGLLITHGGDCAIGAMINDSLFENPVGSTSGDGWYFGGVIDELSLYNRALSSDEILYHYLVAIPEPATLSLLGIGLLALVRRRRKHLGRTVVSLLLAFALVGALASPARAGLVAYWSFDDGSGTNADDPVGGHDGTLTNGPVWTTVTAPTTFANPYALWFDANDDYVVATGYKSETGTSPRTLAAWIRTTCMTDAVVGSWGQNNAGQKWIFRIQDDNGTDGAMRIEVNGGYVVGTTVVGDNEWHHVAVVYDGGPNVTNCLLYVDGLLEPVSAQQSQAINSPPAPLDVVIGRDQHQNRFTFDGLIDDVRIYDHALTLAEVQALAARVVSAPTTYSEAVLNDGAVTYWRLNEASGPTAQNLGLIGAGGNATYQGSMAYGQPGLLTSDPDLAAGFDGSSAQVHILDHAAINTGGPYTQKSIELWFKAAGAITSRQVLYEQGGTTHGFSIYVDDEDPTGSTDGGPFLYVCAWTNNTPDYAWGAFDPTLAHMVDLVLDAGVGTLKGYIDGLLFGTDSDAVAIASHTDDGAIGGIENQTRFHDGTSGGGSFFGIIDEVSTYNVALLADEIALHYSLAATLIPEPASLSLLGVGLLALVHRRRKRRGGTAAPLLLAFVLVGALASPARAGLVAYWSFDDGSGTNADDPVGGYDGTLTNGPVWTTAAAPTTFENPYALTFDGSNDYVSTAYDGIAGSLSRSVAFWVKTTDTSNHGILAWGLDTTNGAKWHVRLNENSGNGTVGAVRTEVQGGYIIGTTVISDGEWHHVASVFPEDSSPNVNDVLLYVDGVLQGTSGVQAQTVNTNIGDTNSLDVTIGRRTQSGTQYYIAATLDDVRIYDHALTLAEVQALAARAVSAPSTYSEAVLTDGAFAYWRLNETSGTTATNLGSLGAVLNGTYTGGITQGVPGLVAMEPDAAARFDRSSGDARVDIPDHSLLNTGGPYVAKTIELWFQADQVTDRQVIYEQGGGTNGLNIYVEDGLLYVGAWNTGTAPNWTAFLSTAVEANERYMVDLVLSGDPSGTTGILTGYLNGEEFAHTGGIGFIPAHSGDSAIGAVINDSRFAAAPLTLTGNGYWFGGVIDEVSLYNLVLSSDQIALHYRLATVPEPATLSLLSVGFLALLARRRKRVGKTVAPLLLVCVLVGALASPARAGLVAYWPFDDGVGTTADEKVANNDGTLTNGPVWTTDTAPTTFANPYALSFDGSNDYVVATGYTGVTGTNARSAAAWIRTTSTGDAEIISWGNNNPGEKWILRIQNDNGTVGAIRIEVNGGYLVGSSIVGDNQWHHVAVVLPDDGSPNVTECLLYVDGKLEPISASQSRAINTTNANVRIGVGHGGYEFGGLIDDVRIYDHALTLAEVQALATRVVSAPTAYSQAVIADGAFAYWRLNEPSGGTATNLGSIGAVLDGTYTGGITQGVPGLVIMEPDEAARFDRSSSNARVDILNHNLLNAGGPYVAKTIELWFQADQVTDRQVIYEQGGNTNGLNIYVEDSLLYVGAWAGTTWQAFLSTAVQPNTRYMVDLVMSGDPSGTSGTLIGYLNGEEFAQTGGVGSVPTHTGLSAIGAMINDTRFLAGNASGNGWWFGGVIDEVSLYNLALSADQVWAHYSLATVPEPASLVLLAGGLVALIRRRK